MRHARSRRFAALAGATVALGLAIVSAAAAPQPPQEASAAPSTEIVVEPPPFSDGIYPCSDCHADQAANQTVRMLEDEHDQIVLRHGTKWCYTCHDPANHDFLRLADGSSLAFSRSHLLCGQCHGPKLRDWRLGIHGKRTGNWKGQKHYLLCAHCHNPHDPRFPSMQPKPPPKRPTDIRL